MATTYYLVRDEGDTLLAIHRTPDSAKATLEKISKREVEKPLRLEIEKITTDQWGTVVSTDVIFRLICEE